MNTQVAQQLGSEIIEMAKIDQAMRKGIWNEKVDQRNTARLKDLILEHGWPTEAEVGEEAANGAWLLVQHADKDPEFQKQALELLKKAVAKGQASKRNLAFLIDRVQVNSGLPQTFGTQFHGGPDGKLVPHPIADKRKLDKLRKSHDLEPFAQYEKFMQAKIHERD